MENTKIRGINSNEHDPLFSFWIEHLLFGERQIDTKGNIKKGYQTIGHSFKIILCKLINCISRYLLN